MEKPMTNNQKFIIMNFLTDFKNCIESYGYLNYSREQKNLETINEHVQILKNELNEEINDHLN